MLGPSTDGGGSGLKFKKNNFILTWNHAFSEVSQRNSLYAWVDAHLEYIKLKNG